MNGKRFLATTWTHLSRVEQDSRGEWQTTRHLEGMRINCLAADPHRPGRVYAGRQEGGVLVSVDGGRSWTESGLTGLPIKALAASPAVPDLVFAGSKPVSLFVSRDGGGSWSELESFRRVRRWWMFSPAEPPDFRPYVQAIAPSPNDPDVLMAGIEAGALARSTDGGQTWSSHPRKALRDCHSLIFHQSDGRLVLEGGGGGPGVAASRDGGVTWTQPSRGLGKKYGWMVAADPVRPEVWYLSASEFPSLLRGNFTPPAHDDGRAGAHIYRAVGGGPWEALGGGLPEPLDYMAYALVTDPAAPGHLYAGLSHGEVWHTADYGDSWRQLPFQLDGVQRTMIVF